MPVQLLVRVRRFRCDALACRRQTFTEPLATVAERSAHTTTRLTGVQTDTGLALDGAAGARYLAHQGLPGSRNTLLRRVQRASLPEGPAPEVVGIDDWAWCKGHHYGMILVDLPQGRPIDILADRATETVATWFQAHPTVTVVAQDRAEAYAAGICQGAPTAVQVADRFHLFQHVAETLEQVFTAHRQDLEAINATQRQAPVPLADGTVAVPVPPPPQTAMAQDTAAHRRAQRLALYEQVWTLHRQGYAGKAIALTQDFAQLVRQRQPEQLDTWLERATQSALTAFQRFATSLREDYAAVKAGGNAPLEYRPSRGTH
jgi:transposase